MAILSPVVRPVHPGPWVTSRFLARKVPCCQVEYLGHFSIGGTWSWAGHEFVGVGADAGGAPDGVVGGVGGGGGQVGGEERVGEVGGGGWRGSLKFERGVVPANERHYHRKIHCWNLRLPLRGDGEVEAVILGGTGDFATFHVVVITSSLAYLLSHFFVTS